MNGGIRELEGIYLTKLHVQTISELAKFRDSPFMPKSIQKFLAKLLDDIGANIKGP